MEETDFEIGHFRNFRTSVTLTLTLDRVIRHTVMHYSSTCTYTENFVPIRRTFYGWTDGRTIVPVCTYGLIDIVVSRLVLFD